MNVPRGALSLLFFGGLLALAGGPTPAERARATDGGAPDASRIVSIGGAVTETLYALGLSRNVVAVDSTSQYPSEVLAEKRNVGYMRQLSPEGVLGLAPSMILAIAGSGPKETMAVLHSAGVPLVIVPDLYSRDGILEKIRLIAKAVGATSRGQCLVNAVDADLLMLDKLRARIERPPRVIFVLSFVNGRAMVAGRNTAADGIIRLAGATNAISEYEGYKQINDEAAVAAHPDAILVMKRSSAENLTAREVFGHPAFAASPAAAHNAFIAMDGLYLLGFGPRTAFAARDLAISLHPELANGDPQTESSVPPACGK
jgi:iron complex transport system substrate-binding protein